MGFQKRLRQSGGFPAKKQIIAIVIADIAVAPGRLGGVEPHGNLPVPGKKILQRIINLHVQQIPVVKAGPTERLVGDLKSQRADQVQGGTGGGAGSGDVAGILVNLR